MPVSGILVDVCKGRSVFDIVLASRNIGQAAYCNMARLPCQHLMGDRNVGGKVGVLLYYRHQRKDL